MRTNDESRASARRWPTPRQPWRPLLLLIALAALVATACGGDDSADEDASGSFAGAEESTDFDDAQTETEAAGEAMEDDAAEPAVAPATTIAPSQAVGDDEAAADESEGDGDSGDQLGSGGQTVRPTAADLGRKLIFTAQVHVEVDDVAGASAEATKIVQDLGGFVFGQNTTGGSEPSSELVFKVLPDDFNRVLAALGEVGELRNQTVTTDDVTERIVDLESRISVAELGVERLRTALIDAPTLEDYAAVERLLLERESELEVMRGQLRTLEDRVDLATITLLLTQDRVENAIELAISTYEGHDEGESCPGQQSSFETGAAVTVCFEIVNVGDQTLTEIMLTDTVLEIDDETQLIEVFGSLDELAPGQSTLVAHQLNPERNIPMRTRVVAVPTDGISPEPSGPSVSTQVRYEISTFEPDEDPGFGDGFGVGLAILQGLWIGVKWILGFVVSLLPLVPVIALLWWGWRSLRRRFPGKPKPPPPGIGNPPPPPPAPTGVTESATPPAGA